MGTKLKNNHNNETSNEISTEIISSTTDVEIYPMEPVDMKEKRHPIRQSGWLRFIAVLISFLGACLVFSSFFYVRDIVKTFESDSFLKSSTYLDERDHMETQIQEVYETYLSEDEIKSGSFISYDRFNERVQEIRDNYQSEIQSITDNYQQWMDSETTKSNPAELLRLTKERDALILQKQKECEQKVINVKSDLISERLSRFEKTKLALSENKDIIYSVYIDKKLVYGPDAEKYAAAPETHHFTYQLAQKKTIDYYFTFTPDALKKMRGEYEQSRSNGFIGLYRLLGGCFVCFLGLLWLIYAADKPTILDRIYFDVALGLVLLAYAAYVGIFQNFAREMLRTYVPTQAYLAGSIFALLYLLTPWLFVTMTKRIKARSFLRSTLTVSLLLFVIRCFRKIFLFFKNSIKMFLDSDRLTRTVMAHFWTFWGIYAITTILFTGLSAAMGSFFGVFLGFLVIIAETFYFAKVVIRKTKSIETLAAGVKAIKSGDFSEKIPMTGVPLVDGIGENVNNLADGLKIALRNEVRAEHMKIELVTNVSHDLKTPLTSIINYVDLLSKEELVPEKANEYVAILQSKSERLKHLVEDLFEVSKANSGTGKLNIEPLSLSELLIQAVGEYEDKFHEKNFDVRLNLCDQKTSDPANKLMINGDSARMWRVLSNLLDNAAKYGMDNTRIYIDCGRENGYGWVSIKNISRYEMNFPVDEITERFKQGDESRSGEGSGLGLAIVKSFMRLQGGDCEITIDGDLFKVLVKAPLV